MERLPGVGLLPRSLARRADTLSLALCLLLRCLHCAQATSPCKEDEYPVGAECCPKCSPGYRVKEPCGEMTGTHCVPCASGTYTAHLNGLSECLPCRACDPAVGLVTRRKCFSTSNTVCSCDRGHFCVVEEGDDCAECRPHSVCGPGQRVRERGTERQDTRCADCPPGTFSPDGTLGECQPWTNCSGPFQREEKPGTNTTDATCSSWGFPLLALPVLGAIAVALVLWSRGQCARIPACPQVKRVVTVVPDVTTMAVEETTSMVPERDRPTENVSGRPTSEPSPLGLLEAARPPRTRCASHVCCWDPAWMASPPPSGAGDALRLGELGDPAHASSDSRGALRPPSALS